MLAVLDRDPDDFMITNYYDRRDKSEIRNSNLEFSLLLRVSDLPAGRQV